MYGYLFVDGLRLESGGDSEFASEHTNGALLTSVLSDRQETGDASEVCYTARSTLLRSFTALRKPLQSFPYYLYLDRQTLL